MSEPTRRALFAGLVFSEEGQAAQAVDIGAVAHYAIPHAGFLRHVEASYVDRQIVAMMKERFLAMRETITEGVIHMLGRDDLFTRASIDHAIENMDRLLESGTVDVDELRTALWMMKFRVTVDVHGDVLELSVPDAEAGDGDL
jgi:hypothetical protein